MVPGRWIVCAAALIFVTGLASAAYAQGQPRRQVPPAPKQRIGVTKGNIERAVKRGVQFLRSQQKQDGSWDYLDSPFKLGIVPKHLTMGCTALCCLAMLKGGVSPDDPAIKKGLSYCRSHPLEHVYCVSCLVLALEALYTGPEPQKQEEKEVTEEEKTRTTIAKDPARDFQKRASGKDRAKIRELIKWLLEKQQANVWRYPVGGEDASNTQYVALAFSAARRLKIPIPADSCKRMAEWFLKGQEKKGPQVAGFPVPAADHSMKKLRKIEKEIKRSMRRIDRKLKWEKDKVKADSMTTSVVDEARERLFAPEKHKMYARGWCYMSAVSQDMPWRNVITGAMTTSGIIALTVCKAYLEGTREYSPGMAKKVDKAIRDGCAWVAYHFTVSENPVGANADKLGGQRMIHHYYYLYGLERAGMITLTPRFGKRDWYREGAGLILSRQRPNGSWDSPQGTSGPVPDTCFAILFLKKATKPIVNLPEPETGEGLFSPSGKK